MHGSQIFPHLVTIYCLIFNACNYYCIFLQAGTSSEPCNATYGGPSAQSELEVQIITAYIHNNKPVYGAIDFHSYGQFVLYPHGSFQV